MDMHVQLDHGMIRGQMHVKLDVVKIFAHPVMMMVIVPLVLPRISYTKEHVIRTVLIMHQRVPNQ
jgi:hypothetical protein